MENEEQTNELQTEEAKVEEFQPEEQQSEEQKNNGNGKLWLGIVIGAVSVIIIAIIAFVIIFINVIAKNAMTSTSGENGYSVSKIEEIKSYISNMFLFDYDEEAVNEYIYRGMVAALDDPYSYYLSSDDLKALTEETSGNFSGIGAMIMIDKEGVKTISGVYKDSPAEKAGLKAGDILYKVDGEDVTGLNLDDAVARVRGEKGTQVKITVIRDGKEVELTATRDDIVSQEVETKILKDGIGYLSFSHFTEVGTEQFETGLTQLKEQGMKSLILDLRNNPGGQVSTAINIADMFLEDKQTIFLEKDKNDNTITYTATSGVICDVPVVVLVNENSASAAELLTGALRDNLGCKVVGTQTFGKGIMQSVYRLYDGESALKLTTAYYCTPSGLCIHKEGITPDFIVEAGNDTDNDIQLEKAIEVLQKQ